jgi:small basic protein
LHRWLVALILFVNLPTCHYHLIDTIFIMAFSKSIILAALLAYAEARFGQEQEPVAAVQALGDAGFGDPGVAATIAGSIPGALLAAASPCDKVYHISLSWKYIN